MSARCAGRSEPATTIRHGQPSYTQALTAQLRNPTATLRSIQDDRVIRGKTHAMPVSMAASCGGDLNGTGGPVANRGSIAFGAVDLNHVGRAVGVMAGQNDSFTTRGDSARQSDVALRAAYGTAQCGNLSTSKLVAFRSKGEDRQRDRSCPATTGQRAGAGVTPILRSPDSRFPRSTGTSGACVPLALAPYVLPK
jgi:hypothetical protein